MPLIIDRSGNPLVDDPWRNIDNNIKITKNYSVISIDSWFGYDKATRVDLLAQFSKIGLKIDTQIDASQLIGKFSKPQELDKISLLELNIRMLKDGRCFSLASRLRSQYKYRGVIRASGDYLNDQIFFMIRCGFDSFILNDELLTDIQDLKSIISPFNEVYQYSVDEKSTVIQKRFGHHTSKSSKKFSCR